MSEISSQAVQKELPIIDISSTMQKQSNDVINSLKLKGIYISRENEQIRIYKRFFTYYLTLYALKTGKVRRYKMRKVNHLFPGHVFLTQEDKENYLMWEINYAVHDGKYALESIERLADHQRFIKLIQ